MQSSKSGKNFSESFCSFKQMRSVLEGLVLIFSKYKDEDYWQYLEVTIMYICFSVPGADKIRMRKAWRVHSLYREKHLHECQGSVVSPGHEDAQTARLGQALPLT